LLLTLGVGFWAVQQNQGKNRTPDVKIRKTPEKKCGQLFWYDGIMIAVCNKGRFKS